MQLAAYCKLYDIVDILVNYKATNNQAINTDLPPSYEEVIITSNAVSCLEISNSNMKQASLF